MKKIFLFAALFQAMCHSNEILPFKLEPPTSIHENSLLHYAKSTYSQFGEEGIIEEILSRLEIHSGFFIEFGAHNGITLCNTRFLWEKGWEGVFIENNDAFYKQLRKNYKNCARITCLKESVTYKENDPNGKTLDHIADIYFPSKEIDLLSIDVDSYDYLIFENLTRKPKIICIEGTVSWHPLLEDRVSDEIAFLTYIGQPIAALKAIGNQKEYQLVCIVGCNYFFVRNDLITKLGNVPTDLLQLWQDSWYDLGLRFPESQEWIIEHRDNNPHVKLIEKGRYPSFPITHK